MIRGITAKWMLAVLASMALPLLGFTWYVRSKVIQERAEEVVRYHLMSTTADLAGQLGVSCSSGVRMWRFLPVCRCSAGTWPTAARPPCPTTGKWH
ncbi:MAG: hypothetical protein R3E96_05790 [Planctomycetota bacterium]